MSEIDDLDDLLNNVESDEGEMEESGDSSSNFKEDEEAMSNLKSQIQEFQKSQIPGNQGNKMVEEKREQTRGGSQMIVEKEGPSSRMEVEVPRNQNQSKARRDEHSPMIIEESKASSAQSMSANRSAPSVGKLGSGVSNQSGSYGSRMGSTMSSTSLGSSQVSNRVVDMIKEDQTYHNAQEFMSISIISHELKAFVAPVSKNLSLPAEIRTYMAKKGEALKATQTKIQEAFQNKKMNPQTYAKMLQTSMQSHRALLDKAQKQGATKSALKRIGDRMQLLKGEIDKLTGASKPGSQLASATGGLSSASFSRVDRKKMIYDYKNLTIDQKLMVIDERRGKIHDMATYFYKEMKEVNGPRIEKELIPLLEETKKITGRLEKGENVDVVQFLEKKLVDVTPEVFHGTSLEERSKTIRDWANKITDFYKKEQEYIGQIKEAPISISEKKPLTEIANSRMADYKKLMQLLKGIEKNIWVPVPHLVERTEKRRMPTINPAVEPGFLEIQFKNLRQVEHHFFLVYNFSCENVSFSGKTKKTNAAFQFENQVEKHEVAKDKRKGIPGSLRHQFINIIVYESGYPIYLFKSLIPAGFCRTKKEERPGFLWSS
jgi:hypothetical protein